MACFPILIAKNHAKSEGGTIGLAWRRVANKYGELADVMEKWARCFLRGCGVAGCVANSLHTI